MEYRFFKYFLIIFCISLVSIVLFSLLVSDPVYLGSLFLLVNWAKDLTQSSVCIGQASSGNGIYVDRKRSIQVCPAG